jgi:hypothetical protein
MMRKEFQNFIQSMLLLQNPPRTKKVPTAVSVATNRFLILKSIRVMLPTVFCSKKAKMPHYYPHFP